jgi:hypothetical protein
MKSQSQTQHLTDAEFSDLLAGEMPSPATETHLAACDFCRSELDSVKDSLGSFGSLSTQWAVATAPARVPVPSRWALGLNARPTWATGLAVTALTGLLVFNYGPSGSRVGSGPLATSAPVVAAAPPSNAEIAEDNRLMMSIDQELSYRAQPAVSTSDLRADSHHGPHHSSTVVD